MRPTRTEGIPLRVVPTGSDNLRRIADALGVPVEALAAPRAPLVLHEAADGTRWLLQRSAQGSPVIRRVGGHATGHGGPDESVLDVLARDRASPQCQALAALIDRLLLKHLTE